MVARKSPGGSEKIALDPIWFSLRDTGQLTTVVSPAVSADIPGGHINVENCSSILLGIDFTKGSVTTGYVWPEFADRDETNWWLTSVNSASGLTPVNLKYAFTADYTGLISIPNPGATWFRCRVYASGTMTGSDLLLTVGRSNSEVPGLQATA